MPDDRTGEAQRGAQAALEAKGGAALARDLLRRERLGVLATASARHAGHPFATLAPFALSADGQPILLLSALAQHTRNLEEDPRASLLVHAEAASAADPRTAPRLTLVGRVRRLAGDEEADARARYLARHPEARGLLQLDFSAQLLEVEEALLVGGFGAAGWIPGDALRPGDAPE